MPQIETIIPIKLKNYQKANKKHRDWWVWIFATLFVILGIGATVTFSIFLAKSYSDGNVLAAYSGAIVAGLTLTLGGITQILVFIHRKQDEKDKRLDKVEHDYTNFFIKNYQWNEMISLILAKVNRTLGISLVFDIKNNCVKVCYDSSIPSFNDLRKEYIKKLSLGILNNKLFLGFIADAYKFDKESNDAKSLIYNAFSSFDTEIKKSAMSVEKFLQAKTNLKYENRFYDFNMKDRIKNYASTVMPYFIIIIHDNRSLNFAAKAIDLLPFMMYYLSED